MCVFLQKLNGNNSHPMQNKNEVNVVINLLFLYESEFNLNVISVIETLFRLKHYFDEELKKNLCSTQNIDFPRVRVTFNTNM